MKNRLLYEDVNVGDEIPPMVKRPTARQLVKWAGISGDYYEIHYDREFALKAGLPGVIVHGWLTTSFLGQLVTDWIGPEGKLLELDSSYREMHQPGHGVTCKGKVLKKYVEGGNGVVECEVWTENDEGRVTTPGFAKVSLPRKAAN